MTLFEQILEAYPELSDGQAFKDESIVLRDDSDGEGAYIAKWEYSKPVPKALESLVR